MKNSKSFEINSAKDSEEFQKIIELDYSDEKKVQFLGGDSSASIPVTFTDKGKKRLFSIWIYGDTLVGTVSKTKVRNMTHFLHNSIGISENFVEESSMNSLDHIKHFWKEENNTKDLKSFFEPEVHVQKDCYYWLMSGMSHKINDRVSEVYIWSPRVIGDGKGDFGFHEDGVVIIRCVVTLDNIMNPNKWNCSQHEFPRRFSSKDTQIAWGTTSVSKNIACDAPPEDHFIYLWGRRNETKKQEQPGLYLARIKIKDFRKFDWTKIDFFSKGKIWIKNDMTNIIRIEGTIDTPETNVNYDVGLSRWFFISNDFLSYDSYLFSAKQITGPYRKEVLYTVKEPFSTTPDIFCYAFKSHPELVDEDSNTIIFTYNCNSMDFMRDYTKPELNQLYIPQFVEVKYSNLHKSTIIFLGGFIFLGILVGISIIAVLTGVLVMDCFSAITRDSKSVKVDSNEYNQL